MSTLRYNQITLQERIVHTMLGTMAVLAIVYCAFLLSVVFSVIERKQNSLAVRDASSYLSTLEGQYSNAVSAIDDSILKENLYARVDGTTFAVRKDAIASYSVLYAR